MLILILEDKGSASKYMENVLRELGHTVCSAFNINDARSLLEENPIECIIADLNMPPDGLTEEQKARTHDGMFTAWIWLTDEVYPKHLELRSATILYSDYLLQFKKAMQQMPREDMANIIMIEKRGSQVVKGLLQAVASIAAAKGV